MIVEHRKTGITYTVTEYGWERLIKYGKSGSYRIIQDAAIEPPKEIKETVRAAKAKKNTESDNDGIQNPDAQLPDGDVGEEQ
jgi:hypothetical protein